MRNLINKIKNLNINSELLFMIIVTIVAFMILNITISLLRNDDEKIIITRIKNSTYKIEELEKQLELNKYIKDCETNQLQRLLLSEDYDTDFCSKNYNGFQ